MPVKKYKKAKENITGRKKEKKGRPWFICYCIEIED